MKLTVSLLIVAVTLLGACAAPSPIPLDNLQYGAKTTTRSTDTVAVSVVTGNVAGTGGSGVTFVAGILIPLSSPARPYLFFNEDDQKAFAKSLRNEIVRLGIVGAAPSDTTPNGPSIRITFIDTFFKQNVAEYSLKVKMEITGGQSNFQREYSVLSSERDSAWERLNTNAYEGKVKAAKILLEKIIPDIEEYISKTQSASAA